MKTDFETQLTPIDFLRASRLLHAAVSSSITPSQPYNFRAHRESEVCIVKSGSCIMNIAGEEIPMKEGDFLFLLPYVSHAFKTAGSEPCYMYYIHFHLDFLSNPLYQLPKIFKMDLQQYFLLYIRNYLFGTEDRQLKSCLENIEAECKSWSSSGLSMINYYILELVLILSRKIHSAYPKNMDFHNPYVEKALSYIHSHYADHITVPEIADHLQISDRYLSRLFFQSTHSTVMDYVHSYRINQSILMMAEGKSLTDIAIDVGYSSPPHYAKVFKKHMGQSPRDYRNSLAQTPVLPFSHAYQPE